MGPGRSCEAPDRGLARSFFGHSGVNIWDALIRHTSSKLREKDCSGLSRHPSHARGLSLPGRSLRQSNRRLRASSD